MIDKQTNTIDSESKLGERPDLTEAWTNRFPFDKYKQNIGTYTVPTSYNTALKGMLCYGEYANINDYKAAQAGSVFTVKLQVDGTDKGEFRVPAYFGDTNAFAYRGDFNFNDRIMHLFDGLQFASGVVIRLVTTQTAVAGLIPQVHWEACFIGKNTTTGATDIQRAETIITTDTANSVILSYTVPADGFTLKDIQVSASVGNWYLGYIGVFVNGQLALELPVTSSAGNTVAGGNFRTFIPFFDGLNLSHGTSIQALCNPIESVNEKYHMINFGNEVAESGGSGGESSYVF